MNTFVAAFIVVWSAAVCAAQPPAPAQTPKPTGVIRGHVSLPNGRPAWRALVRIIGPTGGFPRTATADSDGRYEFTEVDAGDYIVSAGKPGYLALQYGQRRAFERGTVVTVRNGDAIDKVDITLQPSGAISGRVVDENGDPIEGVQVRLMRIVFAAGRRQLFSVADVGPRKTDDQGHYRIYGVAPGQYGIQASLSDGRPGAVSTVVLPDGYGQTYFPGRARPSEARFVTLDLSQELDEVDIMLARGTGAKVSGTVVDSHGKPIIAGILAMTSQRSGGVGTEPTAARSNADGTFEISNLPPSEYVLQVRTGGDVNQGHEGEFAARFVTVVDADVSNINIRTSAGSRLGGRIAFDGGTGEPAEVTLTTMPADFDLASIIGPVGRATGRADGTFLLEDLNGPRRVRLLRAPTGWSLKAVRASGRDVTDDALSFGTADESLTDVEVVLTNHAGSIGGTVAEAQGRVITDYTAIVFATASDRWYQGSRFLTFTRPKPDGTFSVSDLPPGHYYVAAVDRMQGGTSGNPGETQDPAFLESLIPRATRVTLTEGQATTVAMRIIVR